MDCHQVRTHLDELLISAPDETLRAGLVEHSERCPRCARERHGALTLLTSLRLVRDISETVHASPELKTRIMNGVGRIDKEQGPINNPGFLAGRLRRLVLLPATAAALVLLALVLQWLSPGSDDSPGLPAFALISRAWAAEEAAFRSDGVVHISNRILVAATKDPDLTGIRWVPLVALDANGDPRYHQLKLPAEPNEAYTVGDEVWYEPATGHFARTMTLDATPLFANAYDGEAVIQLDADSDGAPVLLRTDVAEDFEPPRNPANFLGMAPGHRLELDERGQDWIRDIGEGTLWDGSAARILQLRPPRDEVGESFDSYWLYKVRTDDDVLAEMEWWARGELLLAIQRVGSETVDRPRVPWNLDGLLSDTQGTSTESQANRLVPSIASDFIVRDVPVERMVERADFETYVFSSNLPWTAEREITDLLDVTNPPLRMFLVFHQADDGRHIVLAQASSFNAKLREVVRGEDVLYQSPNGFKVWDSPKASILGRTILESCRAVAYYRVSDDSVGYILESPAKTFPALAVNGHLTEEELRTLVNSLVPARNVRH